MNMGATTVIGRLEAEAVPATEDKLLRMLNEGGAAEYLNTTRAHLRKMREEDRGPKFYKVGRLVRYRLADLETWLQRNAVTPER
jgi:excisionase family DNA binding protein